MRTRSWAMVMLGWGTGVLAAAAGSAPLDEALADLRGADPVARRAAAALLVATPGDAPVAPLAQLAADGQAPLRQRLLASELLGRRGGAASAAALVQQLDHEQDLAVRGQLCLWLGRRREAAAVPALLAWLKTIGPQALNDLPGKPKEGQPATCYVRHLEALGLIGDERALPAITEFRRRVPANVGVGGFLSHFVAEAADHALDRIAAQATFRQAVAAVPGLAAAVAPLLVWLRDDPVARLRLSEDDVVRRRPAGKALLERLVAGQVAGVDAAVAAGARALLAAWDRLTPPELTP